MRLVPGETETGRPARSVETTPWPIARPPSPLPEADGFFVYLLHCADGTLYAGWTTALTRRLETHNRGQGAKYTRTRLPVTLLGFWAFDDKPEAMRFEWRLKRTPRARKLALLSAQTARRETEEVR